MPNFNILDHLDRLTPDGGSQTKNEQSYHCPACNSSNFKITVSGPKIGTYQGYGCDCMSTDAGKQSIIDAINPRFKKSVRSASKTEFIYNGSSGNPIAKFTRSDDGNGKRNFFQSYYSSGRWVSGMPDEVKPSIPLYRIYDRINRDAITNGEPILIVEGEGKADRLIAMGIAATCSIGGCKGWRTYGQNYQSELEGAKVVICPDRDEPGIKYAEQIAADFSDAQWLYADPRSFEWDSIPKDKGFDVGDWISQGATKEMILGAIEPRRIAKSTSNNLNKQNQRPDSNTNEMDLTAISGGELNSKILKRMKLIQQVVGTDLKLNELRNCLEFKGKPVDPNTYRLFVAHLIDADVSNDDCTMILGAIGKKYAYHPVKEWLEGLHQTHGNSTIDILNTVSSQYLHTSNPLYDRYMLCQMVAAVARVYQPGCKSDHSVIIQGSQNLLKSTFWNTLAGDEWFDDNLGSDVENKDELLKLHRTWFEEWGEIDRITSKKELGVVKSFLSRKTDTFRAPYERTSVEHPRRGVIVGTVNPSEFLRDEEDRRLWIIPITEKIDIEGVKRDREMLWAAAVALYKAGSDWWLTTDEEVQQRESNKQFAVRDVWEEKIEEWVSTFANTHSKQGDESVQLVRVADIISECLEMKELARLTNLDRKRVHDILRRLGWTYEKNPVRLTGFSQTQRVWSKSTLTDTGSLAALRVAKGSLEFPLATLPKPALDNGSSNLGPLGSLKNGVSPAEESWEFEFTEDEGQISNGRKFVSQVEF